MVSRHRSTRVDTVQPENRAGAGALAVSPVALGRRECAVLSGPPELTTVADRPAGFREGLAGAGVTLERVVRGASTRGAGAQRHGGCRPPGARGRPVCSR